MKLRIPRWATRATVGGKPAANGTLFSVACAAGSTAIAVDFAPIVVVERGWGDTLSKPPADAVAVTRGALVFALHPREKKTIVRNFTTIPSHAGDHAPDYLITTGVSAPRIVSALFAYTAKVLLRKCAAIFYCQRSHI